MLCKSLLYTSESSTEEGVESVLNDLEKIRNLNESFNISGALLYLEGNDKRYYAQYLEGPENHINQLYSNIESDKRHTKVHLLYQSNNSVRLFENWSMGYISSEKHKSSTVVASESVVNQFLEMVERGSIEDVVELIKAMYQQEQAISSK